MFYSHEVLTSRRYGVATIWLVATLGNKASSKKVNRKTILEVDIPKACDVVIEPEAPMALRLQSNLLCGISRVYFQQCGYVLVDAQNVQQQMRQLVRAVQAQSKQFDMDTGRSARPDQLLLQDDPNFLPGLEFSLDADLLRIDDEIPDSSLTASLLTSGISAGSQGSFDVGAHIHIPSSSGGPGGFELGGVGLPGSVTDADLDLPMLHDNEELLPEAEFSFDQDRNLFELGNISSTPLHQSIHSREPQLGHVSLQTDDHAAHDEPLPTAAETGRISGAASDAARAEVAAESEPVVHDLDGDVLMSDGRLELQMHNSPTLEPATAMARRIKQRRRLQADKDTEVRKTELLSWNNDYLSNMASVRSKRNASRANVQSKKNAEWWVWGAGIGGVGYDLRTLSNVEHPLAMFQGSRLRELILGPEISRKRPSPEIQDEQGRRVRQRTAEGDSTLQEGDQYLNLDADDMQDVPPEIARRAPTPLDRHPGADLSSSVMPWNQSASLVSSQIGRGAGAPLRGRGSSAIHPQPTQRLTSASPLVGRGPSRRSRSRHSSEGQVMLGEGAYPASSGDIQFDDFAVGGTGESADEFDRFGPAAAVDSLTAADSQWVHKQFDTESSNFLAFVAQAVPGRMHDAAGSPALDKPGILFEELLPPLQNTHVVAAQGLLHALTLATKGVMWVRQEQDRFGQPLWLGVELSADQLDTGVPQT